MFEECFVESWRRKRDESGREFISFRIILKAKGVDDMRIEKRYSEFYKLHTEVLNLFSHDAQVNKILIEAFPPKYPLSLQTDAFAERRSRALDAYLQILTHYLRENKLLEHPILRDFFGIKQKDFVAVKSENIRAIKTPNALNSEIEKLRLALFTCSDLKSLAGEFARLQEAIEGNGEDLRVMEKFYEVKREWEVMKIKSGQYEADNFSFTSKSVSFIKDDNTTVNNEIITSTHVNHSPVSLDNTKRSLRAQEAILSDLAATLEQQKQLSLEICDEIVQQNRTIGEFGRKQEGTIGEFIQSTEKARKLQ